MPRRTRSGIERCGQLTVISIDHHRYASEPASSWITLKGANDARDVDDTIVGRGIPVTTATPGDGFEVMSYSLALTPNTLAKTIAGRDTITLRATIDGVQRLSFSANALTIDSASLDGVPLAHIVQGNNMRYAEGVCRC